MNKKRALIIGLTGSIGMGKSTVARMLARCGLPVFSADQAVHALMGPNGEALQRVAKKFPSVLGPNGIDRKKLAAVVLSTPEYLKWLENILHPLVFRAAAAFVRTHKQVGAKAVVLEIPLLFETGYDRKCDVTLCVSAKAAQQKARVLKRKGMTAQKLRAIVKQQMPSTEKCRRADFVVRTDVPLATTRKQVKALVKQLVEEGHIK